MGDQDSLLTLAERGALERLAQQADAGIDGQRARALLAVADGQSQSAAAEAAGLTPGQVSYSLRKFRDERLAAFPALAGAAAAPIEKKESDSDLLETLGELLDEVGEVLTDLQELLSDSKRERLTSRYSPHGMIVLIRENVGRLTPEVQLDVLRNFQGLSPEELMDIDTWKGMGYMMTYSARFQATQAVEKMTGVMDQVVPAPVHPRRFWGFAKRSVDRLTPDFAKQIAATFKDATARDLVDPDTWKGLWTMLSYSLQFQAEQMRDRLIEQENEQHSS